MSRCFPFPPPGYERQHKPEDLDLLKEVKRKEKKHKKEKKNKDKERKKDKEKKEKDGSDEKHREDKERKGKHKDKKEKHRDKKKEKEDRGKDKEKSSISEESTVAGKLDDNTGGKLHAKEHSKDRNSSHKEGKSFALFPGQNGGKPSQSNLPSPVVNEESKFVQELDRRIRGEEKGTGSQLPQKVAVVNKKDQEMVARADDRNSSGLLAEETADYKNKRIETKLDPQGLRNVYSGNTMAQNFVPMTKSKVEGFPKPANEQNGRRLEGKEKYEEMDGLKRGDKQKDRDRESRAKEKDKKKEKKKDEKLKIKSENTKINQNQLKDDGWNDIGVFAGDKGINLLKDANSNVANEGNIRKRKDMGTNGFLHESEIRPNKMQRPTPHTLTENGRKLEPSQTPTKSPHDKHALPSSVHQVDSKAPVINGIIEAPKPSPLKPKPSAATPTKSPHMKKAFQVPNVEDLIADASRRPPHPDSTYLMEVLTVPKIEDWFENDDQDWLFSRNGPSLKPNVEPVGVKESPCVWSEAVHIESADVCALPYVIPY